MSICNNSFLLHIYYIIIFNYYQRTSCSPNLVSTDYCLYPRRLTKSTHLPTRVSKVQMFCLIYQQARLFILRRSLSANGLQRQMFLFQGEPCLSLALLISGLRKLPFSVNFSCNSNFLLHLYYIIIFNYYQIKFFDSPKDFHLGTSDEGSTISLIQLLSQAFAIGHRSEAITLTIVRPLFSLVRLYRYYVALRIPPRVKYIMIIRGGCFLLCGNRISTVTNRCLHFRQQQTALFE